MQILYNANIHTLDDHLAQSTALVIDDQASHYGRVIAAGSDQEILDSFERCASKQDMGGAVILPGLCDAHIHLQYYAQFLKGLDLFNCSKQDCVGKVAELASRTASNQWIIGHGWTQSEWLDGLPAAADLDPVSPKHPVLLTSASLHSAWANSAALKAAGVTAETSDPPKGRFRRLEDGSPNGLLIEDAIDIVTAAIPTITLEENAKSILEAQTRLWQFGLTSVHDFDRIPCFETLQNLQQRGELRLRVLKSLPVESLEQVIALGLHSGFGDDMLRIGSIKVFADGALGSRTAAMLQPYQGEPENFGMLFFDGEQFFETARQAADGGLSMAVHAIGDKANHEILNGYTQLRAYEKQAGLSHLRHRIEHVQVMHPDDISRLAELDVIASMQPIHATADMLIAEKYWGQRARYSYAWHSLLDKGTHLAFGSDAPVDSPNPFLGLYAAVTRCRCDGSPGSDGWQPQERLALDTALQAYTSGAAYAAGMEDRLGKLAPGYLADLIVLTHDLFACHPEQLLSIKPLAVMLGGQWVWQA